MSRTRHVARPLLTAYDVVPKTRNNKQKHSLVLDELRLAENNCDVILQAAEEMISRSLLFHDLRNPDGMIEPLRQLVLILKTVYAFIRRDLRHSNPDINIDGRIAPDAQQRPVLAPEHFDMQQTLCPMVLFFRIIAQGLNAYRINVPANDWGPIRPLHALLKSLQVGNDRWGRHSGLQGVGNKSAPNVPTFFPGLASCIMFHEQDQVFTIASSRAAYNHLGGLGELTRSVRDRHMAALEARLGRAAPELREGMGATFNPLSGYLPTCFLDHFRFVMDRPPAAVEDELGTKKIFGTETCAEWEYWIMALSGVRAAAAAECCRLRNTPPAVTSCTTFPIQTQQPMGVKQTWNSAEARVEPWDPPEKRHDEEEDDSCCCAVM